MTQFDRLLAVSVQQQQEISIVISLRFIECCTAAEHQDVIGDEGYAY